jgi:hypothetical protein
MCAAMLNGSFHGGAWFLAGLLLGGGVWAGLWSATDAAPEAPAAMATASPARAAASPGWEPPGDGFLVWESNRSGSWRLWTQRLDGSGLRQLTPDTPEDRDRSHCCAHVSPDGRWIAYLSLEPGPDRYPEGRPERGVLRLIRPDGTGGRALAPAARAYGEHRAVVWLDGGEDGELVHIDGEGYMVRRSLASGHSERLTRTPHPTSGWLPNPTLTHAVSGIPTFSLYDAGRRDVTELQAFGGCQAWFTQDGRWGYWIAGAGGPIHKIDLRSRAVSVLFGKSDPRMPGDQGYLYFPMLSADRRLLAFGASAGGHDHFTADYDIYVAEVDPERLEVIAAPVRFAPHPATDRFPAVHLEPSPLGVHTGEAPFTVRLAAPPAADGEWRWSLGDGAEAAGREVEHTFARPGSYEVVARGRGRELQGRVRVTAARPPGIEAVTVRGRRQVIVRFDEPVAAAAAGAAGPRATLASGGAVSGSRLEDGGRELVLELAEPLMRPDTLRLAGITDRAGRPNAMPPRELPLTPDTWPAGRDGLLWETAGAPNRLLDPGVERSFPVSRTGEARVDPHQRMDLGGGSFTAGGEAAEAVVAGVKRTNQLTLEATVETRAARQNAPVVSLAGAGPQKANLVLAQQGDELVLRLMLARHGLEEHAIPLGRLRPGSPTHVLVSYRPGRLDAYRDGEPVAGRDLEGDFFRWRPRPLVFGASPGDGGGAWSGFLEGIAFYGRAFSPEEARESARRYLEKVERRPEVPVRRLRGRLVARSRTPTLQDISPYREALAVYEYQVDQERVRVAHWVILDGRTLPVTRRREGETVDLALAPFDRNPQLESIFLSDTLPPAGGAALYHDTGR